MANANVDMSPNLLLTIQKAVVSSDNSTDTFSLYFRIQSLTSFSGFFFYYQLRQAGTTERDFG